MIIVKEILCVKFIPKSYCVIKTKVDLIVYK